MGRVPIILFMIIMISIPKISISIKDTSKDTIETRLSPMEALDLVKEKYASNFIKSNIQEDQENYFYKLEMVDYYLVYEDTDNTTGYHLIHLYEFIIDDEDTGIGHTVTYGWYWVDPYSGDIELYPDV